MTTEQIPRITGQKRQQTGTRHAARLREAGQLPAVIYGHKLEPAHVALDRAEITDLLHNKAHLIELAVDDKAEPCLIKDVQWDHLGSRILHVDLVHVDLTERVTVDVEIELVGEAVGLKETGAYLEHPATQLSIQCLASQIPDSIKVDITDLQVGQSITVNDLELRENVTVDDDPETVVAVIHVAAAVDEDAEAAAAAEAEPELIRKKEKAGEGSES